MLRRLPIFKRFLSANAACQKSENTIITRLPNGLRVATEHVDLPTATVGFFLDAGSRYENHMNNGVAHFLEHMFFKGSHKRSQMALEMEVETIGAHLNAYTSREMTAYYAKCLNGHVDQCVDILADIILNSRLGKVEIERERGVILREMQEIEGNLQEVVFDHLHSIAYSGSSLSYTILGPPQNIRSIKRQDLVDYIKTHYKAERLVLAASGGVDHDSLVELAYKYFGHLESSKIPFHEDYPYVYTGSDIKVLDPSLEVVHAALAVEGPCWRSADSIPMMVANALVGMWDCSQVSGLNVTSKLAKTVQANKLAYCFQSFNTSYFDTGLWGVYFVSDEKNASDMISAVVDEWKRICSSISDSEVKSAKNLLKATLLYNLDGSTPICDDIARQLLFYGRRISYAELDARINDVDESIIREICSNYIRSKDPVLAAVGPTKKIQDYKTIKKYLKW